MSEKQEITTHHYEGEPPYYCVYCREQLIRKEFDTQNIPIVRIPPSFPRGQMKQFVCERCKIGYLFVMRDIDSLSVREIYISQTEES